MSTIVHLEEDDEGNLVLPLSEELCEKMGWKEGDTILWEDLKNGSFSLKKKSSEVQG